MSVGRNLPTVAIGGGFMHDNLSDRSKPFWMGFATVSIPLSGWWEGSHDMKRARLAVRNNENSLRDGSELLIINMQNTWNEPSSPSARLRRTSACRPTITMPAPAP